MLFRGLDVFTSLYEGGLDYRPLAIPQSIMKAKFLLPLQEVGFN